MPARAARYPSRSACPRRCVAFIDPADEEGQSVVTIESTPEFVSGVYARMDRRLDTVRRHLGRPLGLADKVLLAHLDDPAETGMMRGETYSQLRPDRVVFEEGLG